MRVNKYDIDEQNTEFSFHNLKRALSYSKKYKKKLFLVLCITLFSTIIGLLYAKLIQYGIDNVIESNNYMNLVKLSLIGISIQIMVVLSIKFKSDILTKVNENIVEDLKNDLFSHIQYLSSEYYDTRPHGKILVRLTEYAENVSSLITNCLIDTILQVISLVLTLIFMLITSVKLTLITLVGVAILGIIFNSTRKIKRNIKLKINNKRSNMNAYFYEYLIAQKKMKKYMIT